VGDDVLQLAADAGALGGDRGGLAGVLLGGGLGRENAVLRRLRSRASRPMNQPGMINRLW
jgi:hypothetical protein